MSDFLKGCTVHILPSGIGKKRMQLLGNQIQKYGGVYISTLAEPLSQPLTHVAVEDDTASVLHTQELSAILKDPRNKETNFVKVSWVCDCLQKKTRICETSYGINKHHSQKQSCKRKHSLPNAHTMAKMSVNLADPTDLAANKTSNASQSQNTSIPNQLIISELQKLTNAFSSSGDKWRSYAYTKAIGSIKKYGKAINSYEEALTIPGLGTGMAAKVWELLETGTLRRVKEVCEGEHAQTLELFTGVWGAGSKTAQQWYDLGCRTLDDLRKKATLTNQQKIGLQYYDDIQQNIPRTEVTEIVKIVEKHAKLLYPDIILEACGSYRRGKPLCGDIDIIITHPTKDLTRILLVPLLKQLRDISFITEDLVKVDGTESPKKYFGLCKLPGEGNRHRRLDIFIIPWSERGPALLHYTGSALFNRSIRLLAQKKGMSLTEHALHKATFKDGDKTVLGDALFTPNEESVFRLLEIPFRPPEDREDYFTL